MLNSALAARQVKEKIGPHYSPTQSRSPAHSGIRISDIQYALLDEVHDLTVERGLEPIGHVAHDLFAHVDGPLADRRVKRDRPFDRFR